MLSAKYILASLATLAAIFIAIVALIMGIGYYATKGLGSVVQRQLTALRAGNIEKAYSYSSKEFKAATSYPDFKDFVTRYPILTTNVDAHFSKREFENENGKWIGVLIDKDGKKIPIRYYLVYEDKTWKIFGFKIGSLATAEEDKGENQESADNVQSSSPENVSLTNTYQEGDGFYSIKYPSDWKYEKTQKGTIVFSGPKGKPSYFTTVNIQTVLTLKNGGKYKDLDDFINNFKAQAKLQKPYAFYKEGKISHDGMDGRFLELSYTYQGEKIKQLQYVFLNKAREVFFAWAYTAPEDQYDAYMPYAKAMFPTWDVK